MVPKSQRTIAPTVALANTAARYARIIATNSVVLPATNPGIKPQSPVKRDFKTNPRNAADFPTGSGTSYVAGPADTDPYGSYFFALEINGTEVAHFKQCSGLKNKTAVVEHTEGGVNGRTHKLPGQTSWDNITLKYSMSASTAMLEWRDGFVTALATGAAMPARAQGSIAVMNNAGTVVRRYLFTGAWPVSWAGADMDANSSAIAIETVEIAHDGLYLANPGAGSSISTLSSSYSSFAFNSTYK